MKKISLLILLSIFLFNITGCFKRDNFEDIMIYTSVYPIEYITERLYGEHSTIRSIYPDGVNFEKYPLTNKQISDYSKGNLFIFNGLGNEKDYIIPMLEHNKKMKIIDTTLSMEVMNDVEELWLDPSNFLMLAQNIRNGFKEYINSHYLKNEIDEKYEQLKVEISDLDAKIKFMMESTDNPTIVVSNDMFKFLEKYNFKVFSLEENENLTEKTIADVKTMIQNKKIDYIFLKQNEEPNETIKNIQKETNVKLSYINTIATITEENREATKDYITMMNENIELLKNELYD